MQQYCDGKTVIPAFKKYKILVLTTVVMQIWKEKLVFFAYCCKIYEITNKDIAAKLKNMVWYGWIELGFVNYYKYLWKFRSAGNMKKVFWMVNFYQKHGIIIALKSL